MDASKLGIRTPNEELRSLINLKRGPVNCHAHIDRAFTASFDLYSQLGDASLPQKWGYIDELKRSPEYLENMRVRMDMAIRVMRENGCNACRTYIDADSTIGMKAIEFALDAKEYWAKRGFILQIAASPVKGITEGRDRDIFLEACDLADVVGGLPSRGRRNVKDLDASRVGMNALFDIALKLNKPIDMQIDQENHPQEVELETLMYMARHYRKEGYTQPISAVHAISIASWHDREKRQKVLNSLAGLGISVIVCPGAALSMRHTPSISVPSHNSIAPVKDLLDAGVNVAFGVDNVEDMYMPFTTGDIYEEIREMLRAIRWQGPLGPIVEILTTNGREALGLD